MHSVIINSVEAFGGRGSGITSFAQALISAWALRTDVKLDLLLSVDSTASNPLAGSNLLKRYTPMRRTEKILTALKVNAAAFARLPGLKHFQNAKEVGQENALYKPLCEQVFSQIPSRYESNIDQQGSRPLRGFQFGERIFPNALALFKSKRLPLHIRVPKSSSLDGGYRIFHNPLPFPMLVHGWQTITTIHDLIPITHPELCLDDPAYFYDLVSICLAQSAAIHCISHHTAQSLVKYFGEAIKPKLFVAHQPIPLAHLTPQFKAYAASALHARYEQPSGFGHNYILQVGSIEPKKNHRVMIDAFRILRLDYPDLRLVVIGKPGWLSDELCDYLSSARDEGIEWQSKADYRTLIRYITNASAVAFPSIVEGWGLPPLEAMSLGTPVVVSPIDACMEACGNAAVYMDDPWDAASLANRLIELLSSRERANEMATAGFEQAQQYSLSHFKSALQSGYEEVLA